MGGKEREAARELRESFEELKVEVERLSRLLEELNEGIRIGLGKDGPDRAGLLSLLSLPLLGLVVYVAVRLALRKPSRRR
ncbi:hypothetical protein RxyAA322_22720 [Rubrobacter xylanophilus]|uniref:Uncharacterized protein n=1 Tax=Rubrobacter xylanophilus TaxID=49319 RepID=A0A510HKM7_9ACTN|nr:hypothetical protein [Rubrobacter xylanophilus]BBL80418.1 hypothetical protein RxyAA322_22720 [Rubrobacter xylanophilus]